MFLEYTLRSLILPYFSLFFPPLSLSLFTVIRSSNCHCKSSLFHHLCSMSFSNVVVTPMTPKPLSAMPSNDSLQASNLQLRPLLINSHWIPPSPFFFLPLFSSFLAPLPLGILPIFVIEDVLTLVKVPVDPWALGRNSEDSLAGLSS